MTSLIATKPEKVTILPPSGTLSHVFANPKSEFANAQFNLTMVVASAQSREINAANEASHARYQAFEGVLEDSYSSRGLGGDLDKMAPAVRKALVEAASDVYAIHEVAEAARADVRECGAEAIEKGKVSFDKTLQNVLARHM